ncbi:Transcription initiation factor TFIID subunit 9 [Malassezia sp. CBS 17886]|nr:Transcription initiation factor TFIID subunit 9 [Malassezia sp. CBS 17886]
MSATKTHAGSQPSGGNANAAPMPRDVRLVSLILASMGVDDAEPAVLVQLLEFANRYTNQVLQDALVYADHVSSRQGGSNVSIDDVQLAIQSRVNYSFSQPPPHEMLLSLASSLNSIPLPPVSNRYGVRLPPAQHCLTNVNFAIVPDPPLTSTFGDSVAAPEVDAADAAKSDEHANGATPDAGSGLADTSMDDASQQHGTKRQLDEDEDYD